MKIISSLEELNISENAAVTVGKFDGVHLGHLSLIRALKEEAAEKGLKTVVFSLEIPNNPRITSREETAFVLEKEGVDCYVSVVLSDELRRMQAETFLKDILLGRCRMKALISGPDFRFGRNGEGDIAFLSARSEQYGFSFRPVPYFSVDCAPVSSTRIRALLSVGNVDAIPALLGRPYAVSGTVVHGAHLGRTLHFPTINLVPDKELSLPLFGVYATVTEISGARYFGVSDLGVKPTVSAENQTVLETHLFDFSGDLYGKKAVVRFISMLRAERKFESAEALKAQISVDCEAARCLFNGERFVKRLTADEDVLKSNKTNAPSVQKGTVMLEKIREILSVQLNIDQEEVTESANFRDDLGVDSLDLFEMILSLEEEYGFEVPAEALEKIETVGDAIEYFKTLNIEA